MWMILGLNNFSFNMMKNTSCFMLKTLFVRQSFIYLSWLFGYVGKWLVGKVNFKMYDVADWITDNWNTHISQYLKN